MGSYITVSVPRGTFKAFLAIPAVLPAPAIVVLQEAFGVNADLRETCEELAAQGYLAISPDLYWRMEPGLDLSPLSEVDWKKGFALYAALDFDAAVADIVATMGAARTLQGANGKVGIMGYCLGALMTFIVTARHGADASVAYYGARTEEYLSEVNGIRNPLLMHLGEEDEYISKDARGAIIEALARNVSARVFTYPGCSHAFARHGGVHYDKDAATLANGRTADFFAEHLKRNERSVTRSGVMPTDAPSSSSSPP